LRFLREWHCLVCACKNLTTIYVVYGLKQLLKKVNSLKSLREKDPLKWFTIKLVQERIVTEGSSVNYQGAPIKNYNFATLEYCKKQAVGDLERLYKTMQERLEWLYTRVLRATLVFLDTKSWVKKPSVDSDDDTNAENVSLQEVKGAIELLRTKFKDPLEATAVNIPSIQDEIEDAVVYARNRTY